MSILLLSFSGSVAGVSGLLFWLGTEGEASCGAFVFTITVPDILNV